MSSLKSIILTNFKGIGQRPVRIDLKPITLLFGANSAGKSTMLQGLHYAREVLERRQADIDRTILGGDVIDLGGFQGVVHQHEHDRRIGVTVDVWADDDPLEGNDPLLDLWTASSYGNDALNVSGLIDIECVGVHLSTAWDAVQGRAWISQYTARINEMEVASIGLSGPNEPPEITNVNWDHPLMVALAELPSLLGEVDLDRDDLIAMDAQLALRGLASDLYQHLEWNTKEAGRSSLQGMTSVIPDWNGLLLHEPDIQIRDELQGESGDGDSHATIAVIFRSLFGQCLIGVGKRVLHELQRIRYVGPIREVPLRDHHRPRSAHSDRWASGLAAWDALQADYQPNIGGGLLVQAVNKQLADRDRVGIGYEMDVVGSRRLDDDSIAMLGLQRLLREYDDHDAQAFKKLVWEPLQTLPIEPRVVLYDQRHGVSLAPQDIGVGVSQVVPVVVAALAGRAGLIAIEQPELHIHPKVQVGLADLFIEQALKENRIFLLETHSEHLVLRLLRRIRETSDGELPRPELAVRPQDVAIIWAELHGDGLSLTELPVDDDGEFLRSWPQGFFDERAAELF